MPLEDRLIDRLNLAARELVFLAEIEGISHLSRGGKGCVFRALEWLRPDIATAWSEQETADGLLSRLFPEQDEGEPAGNSNQTEEEPMVVYRKSYQILSAETEADLTHDVLPFLNEGWRCKGGMKPLSLPDGSQRFYQTMIRKGQRREDQ